MSGCIRTTSTCCSKQTRREKQQEWVFLCSNLYISVFFSFLSLWIENERVRQSVGSADLSNVSVCPQDTQLYRHVETVTSMLLLMWDSALQIHQTPLIKTVILAHRPPLVSLCERLEFEHFLYQYNITDQAEMNQTMMCPYLFCYCLNVLHILAASLLRLSYLIKLWTTL